MGGDCVCNKDTVLLELLRDFCKTGDLIPFVKSLSSSSEEEEEDEAVLVWAFAFKAVLADFCLTEEDFAGGFPFLLAAEASSCDEEESEDDSICVFFAVEFVLDFGGTEDVCSLGVLALLHVLELVLGLGTFSDVVDFFKARCLDAVACVHLDLSGEGFRGTSSLLSENSKLLSHISVELAIPLVRLEDTEAFLLFDCTFEDEGSLAGTAVSGASPHVTCCASFFFFFALCFFFFLVAPSGGRKPFTSLASCLFFLVGV